MVSCFVTKEDSLGGCLSFSIYLLLTMQMANHVQTCGTKHVLAVLFRGSLHTQSRLEAVAQCLHFCDSVVKGKLGLFRFVFC